MPILFAVGVAYGLSKDKDGAAALAGLVAFEIVTTLLSTGAVSQIMGYSTRRSSCCIWKN
ncbi:PTS permease for N-acetylglucosamine and glucose [Fusobacterium vincentii ATCC 49256]|nr:PTS permease for N-acetylglucosamine and glucose [Fusobacterium vincentii ATCC 49256]